MGKESNLKNFQQLLYNRIIISNTRLKIVVNSALCFSKITTVGKRFFLFLIQLYLFFYNLIYKVEGKIIGFR